VRNTTNPDPPDNTHWRFKKKHQAHTIVTKRLGSYFIGTYHLCSRLGFGARVIIDSGLVLYRLLPSHYIKYTRELIYHIKETLPARINIESSLYSKLNISLRKKG
jgi:hypothetical protein